MAFFHAVEGLAVRFPANRGHRGVVPVVFALDVVSKGGFGGGVPDGSGVVGVDSSATYVELSEVGDQAGNARTVALVQGLVVDGFMICFDVELSFQGKLFESDVFILVAFDVVKEGL